MKFADNLHLMILISFVAHVMTIGISSIVLKRTHPFYVPSSYKVKIVTPEGKKRRAGRQAAQKATQKKKAVGKKAKPMLSREQIKMVDEKIERIKSKKRDERIDELESMINSSIKEMSEREAEESVGEGTVEVEAESSEGGGIMAKYISDIAQQIRREWVYPDFMNNDLVAAVQVTIDRTGNIRVLGIEESSGNALFDKSVLRAINKASPVARPPFEMKDVVLRFHP